MMILTLIVFNCDLISIATLTPELEQAYQLLFETVEQQFQSSGYVVISLGSIFARSLALSSLQQPKKEVRDDYLVASSLADV